MSDSYNEYLKTVLEKQGLDVLEDIAQRMLNQHPVTLVNAILAMHEGMGDGGALLDIINEKLELDHVVFQLSNAGLDRALLNMDPDDRLELYHHIGVKDGDVDDLFIQGFLLGVAHMDPMKMREYIRSATQVGAMVDDVFYKILLTEF